jgi:UDP-N-acetylglucosamine pyrophosphorylase
MIQAFDEFRDRMKRAGCLDPAIRAFQHSYECLVSGETGLIPETSIEPLASLPRLREIGPQPLDSALLGQVVIVKLNGGLGTSMGLEKAKSLLRIRDDLNFLDFIARQILHLRARHGYAPRFLLMNSFNTSTDTLAFLARYPDLGEPKALELMQSAAPKVDAQTLRPVSWPRNPDLEWCPPGHGDIYPSLFGSGRLDQYLAGGAKYLFVSNSDNLGASLDPDLLAYFAASGLSFMTEVCERTAMDRKGGHLALQQGRLLLRESAQCPESDLAAFQDIQRHRFFSTNNLWIRLDYLKRYLDAHGGFVPLPLIKNPKTADPRDKHSTKVLQLETAMGAAIGCFENTGAIVVPRTRFAPVKTTADLLAIRSDTYVVTEDLRIVLTPGSGGAPPAIDLDPEHYKLVDQLDAHLAHGIPSLAGCRALTIRGSVQLSSKNRFKGKVTITNSSGASRALPDGDYEDVEKVL